MLQASSAALVTVPAAVAGGMAGVAVARAFDKHEDEHLYVDSLQKFDFSLPGLFDIYSSTITCLLQES